MLIIVLLSIVLYTVMIGIVTTLVDEYYYVEESALLTGIIWPFTICCIMGIWIAEKFIRYLKK